MNATPQNLKVFFGPTIPFAWTAGHPYRTILGCNVRRSTKIILENYNCIICNINEKVITIIDLNRYSSTPMMTMAAQWYKEGSVMPFNIYLATKNHPVQTQKIDLSSIFTVKGSIFYFPLAAKVTRKKVKRLNTSA